MSDQIEDPNEDQHDATVIQLRPDTSPDDTADTDVLTGEIVSAPERVRGKGGQRRDIIPKPIQRDQIKATLKFHRRLNWHRLRFHGLRLPAYLVLGIARSAQLGMGRAYDVSRVRSGRPG